MEYLYARTLVLYHHIWLSVFYPARKDKVQQRNFGNVDPGELDLCMGI